MGLPPPGGRATSDYGRELELTLAGAKPAAMFGDRVPDGPGIARAAAAFAPHVAAGRVVEHRSDHRRPDGRVAQHRVVDTLPGEEWRAAALHALHERLYAGRGRGASGTRPRSACCSATPGRRPGGMSRAGRGRRREDGDGGGAGGGGCRGSRTANPAAARPTTTGRGAPGHGSGTSASVYLPPVSTTWPVTARRIRAWVTSCLACRPASASVMAGLERGTPSHQQLQGWPARPGSPWR